MYCERKRKQQLFIYPRKTSLTAENAYGKRLLEKMGWSEGKGLGVDLHGMKEPLKLTLKNDNKGLGFQENEDYWVENQRIFDKLLLEMNGGNRDDDNVETITSLEQQSMRSRSRLNYRKYARGKDLSKCNEKDLASILGMNKSISYSSKVECQPDSKSDLTNFESEVIPEPNEKNEIYNHSEITSRRKKRKNREFYNDEACLVDNCNILQKKKSKKSVVDIDNFKNVKVKRMKNKHKSKEVIDSVIFEDKIRKKKGISFEELQMH